MNGEAMRMNSEPRCKTSQPGWYNQPLSAIATFYAFPLTSPSFQSPRAHTSNFSPLLPLNIFIPLLYIKRTFGFIHVLSIKKIIKTVLNKKPNNLHNKYKTFHINTLHFNTP